MNPKFDSQSKSPKVRDLIDKRNYSKAIDALKAELQKRKGDDRLRVQLAEVMVLAGRKKDAAAILSTLADDLALEGQAGKAIAALKKLDKLEPGREDVGERLSYLIKHQSRPANDPWSRAKQAIEKAEPLHDVETAAAAQPVEAPFGMEEIAEDQPTPELSVEVGLGDSALAELFAGDEARDQIVALLEEVFTPVAPLDQASVSVPVAGEPPMPLASALFQDFAQDELFAVMQGLRLLTFKPGEIIVGAGEPGESMFILTTGQVRAYVKNKAGRQVQVREMRDGDFFGEISVLSGNPRSATITAATRCELLELDRDTLNQIAGKHPHVRTVLQEFYRQRVSTSVETAAQQARD